MSQEFYIAGVQHHKSHEVIGELKKETNLSLVPEPTNKFDPNAIAIKHTSSGTHRVSTMLGYVPAKFAAAIGAQMVIHEDDLQCTITELNPAAKPWERIKVLIATDEEMFEAEDNLSNEEY